MDQILTIRASRHWPVVSLTIVGIALAIVLAAAGYLKMQDYLETRNPPTPTKFAGAE